MTSSDPPVYQFPDRLATDAYRPFPPACHSVVDPAPYVKNCEYDLCSCRTELADCYCVHLADYASACAARGVQIPWRAEIGMCGKWSVVLTW